MHIRRLTRSAVLTGVLALTLTACGGDTSEGGDQAQGSAPGGSGELTPVTVGVLPIADTAPMYLGVEKGIFEEHGLDVELEVASGGAAVVPGVMSGDYQFGFSNAVSVMVGRDKGLPLEVVAAGVATTGDPDADMGAIMTGPDSSFQDAGDLEGARVAVNNVSSIGTVLVSHVVEQNGGDPSTIEFVELGFPDMPAALDRGDVDAAWIFEPFITIAGGSDSSVLTHLLVETDPELMLSVYFADEGYLEDNPDVHERFVTATNEALAYAEEHPEETREILGTYTQIPEEVRAEIVMPRYPSEINESSLELLAELSQKYDLIGDGFEVESVLP